MHCTCTYLYKCTSTTFRENIALHSSKNKKRGLRPNQIKPNRKINVKSNTMRAAYCCPSSAMILSLSIVLFAMRMLRSSQHGVQVAAQDMSRTTVAPTKPCKCKKGKDGMNPSVEPCGSSKTECEQDSAYRWCALTSTCDPPGDDSCDKAECERDSANKGSYQYCAVTQTCDPPGDDSCDKAECEQDSFSTVSYQWCALTRTCNALDDPCEETPPTPAPSLIPSSIAQEEIVLGVVDIDQPQPELSSSDASMSVAAGTAEVEAAGADAVTRTQPPTSAPTLSSTTYLHPTFSPTTTYIPTSYGTTFGPTTTYLPTSYATTFGPTTFSAAVVIVRPVITKIDSRESSYDDCDGGALLCSPFKTAALIIGILLLILVLLLCCCYQYYYKMQQQQQQQERDAADAEQPKNDELELDTSDDSSNGQNPDDGSTNTATLQFGRRLVDYVVTIKSSRSGRKSQVRQNNKDKFCRIYIIIRISFHLLIFSFIVCSSFVRPASINLTSPPLFLL